MSLRLTKTTFTTCKATDVRVRRALTCFLIVCLWMQAMTPPAMAARTGPSPIVAMIANAPSRAGAAARQIMATVEGLGKSAIVFLRATMLPQDNWTIVLTPTSAEFKDYVGLDYHQPSRKLLLSANNPAGQPNNFELMGA